MVIIITMSTNLFLILKEKSSFVKNMGFTLFDLRIR